MTAESIHRRSMADLVESTAARIVEQATADGVPVEGLPEMKLRWYHIGETRNVIHLGRRAQGDSPDREYEETTEANVYVYDRIGGSLGVNAKQFATDLEAVDADTIHLRINSPGGAVFEAKAIMNTLRAHPARVVSHIDGVAASAATVVMLAGDEIVVEPGGELMVHRASSEYSGDDLTVDAWKTWLQRQTEDIAGLYSQRSGRPTEEWDEMMTAETWFYGDEAVAFGLADRAVTLTRPVYEDEEITERMQRKHSLRGYRYEGRAAAPSPLERRSAREAEVAIAKVSPDPERRRWGQRQTGRVSSEVRAAGQVRSRALDRGMVRRSAPAGVTTMSRRAAPSGDIDSETVEHRGRQMYRTHGAFTVYGRRYEMWDMYGPYLEEVIEGAGAATMSARDLDCVFLLNHTGTTMARTAGPWNDYRGTLNVQERQSIGWHEAFLSTTRPDVLTMIEAIDHSLITEMSFAFMIEDGQWNDDMTVYSIRRYNMHRGDVSAVNFGASPYTDISARASEILDELGQMPAGAISEAVRILSQRVGTYEQLLRDADPGALARIAEPALTRGETTIADKAAAAEWTLSAFGSPASKIGDADIPPAERHREDDETGSEQDEPSKVIDNTRPQGPTVAGYEALAKSLGITLPQ